jgi:hypothetical protein
MATPYAFQNIFKKKEKERRSEHYQAKTATLVASTAVSRGLLRIASGDGGSELPIAIS